MRQPGIIEFDDPYFDRWGFPPSLQIETSGEADVQLSDIVFDPNTWTTWSRIVFWGIFVLGTILFFNRDLIPNLDSLTVRWTSGRVQEVTEVPAQGPLTIREPE